ncbi:[acyl-carrier-protein] S-malonyltransferase [Marinitoga hydrogenitolerans DSM 16785]|uniref:Malonyl CoA-acyl carrier protein transacylase n=1 Tax=Marinitoga hydrogenitolerans (strain DSM 16785 / JCM 12826 / AT1271) TaxID=1122195 RepID=A0A1M4S5K4_MARH1|nr:ACP S-malonyltransferase [Marinitoga hydrogenitolerans]SHE27485.1 [acyl-carrier-protein] S-malonyltransferase [Marinitoga hydrogenitolerans DSM 16785]
MIAFVFPGQGSQTLNMGKELLEEYPEYKKYLDIASKTIDVDLESIIFGDDEKKLTLTENTQPSLLTISYIMYLYAKEKLNIIPDIVAGHSLGEWTALAAAEVLSFEDAVKLVRLRGKYMSEACPPGIGGMGAVIGLSIDKISEIISQFENINIANHNSPEQIVISGDKKEILEALKLLKEAGAKKVVELNVSGPFHSKLVFPAQEKMEKELKKLKFKKPIYKIIQNYTAQIEENPQKIRENLVKQITGTVRWVETIQKMKDLGVKKVYEVGPGKVLAGLIKRIDKTLKPQSILKV